MKLTFILVFLSLLHIEASTYSQNTKFTLDLKNVTVENVFNEIKNNSEFEILYATGEVDLQRLVSISVKQQRVETILNQLFSKTAITYKIVDKQIVLSLQKESSISAKSKKVETVYFVKKEQNKITGIVTDANGSLPGVNVIVQGTATGTTTDFDGNYSIEANKGDILVFSFIGMTTQSVTIGDSNTIDVVLIESESSLDEVVVVGYGTQKKANVTGSVASISTEELANRPVPKMGEVLRGMSPNLNIGLSTLGGEPGASSSWNIRGLGSLSGNDSPLILVDGVEMNINNIDPTNVASITILKDASASAIYGARAPFGVILITTKKGKKDGSVSIQYNNNFSFGTPIGIGHLESSIVYATAYNQASINAGSAPIYNDAYLARIQGYLDGTYLTEYDPAVPPHNIWAGRRVGNANYDWPHELIAKNKMDQKHSLNVSGGNEKTQYYTSIGYFDQDGFLAYGHDDYKRIDFMVNLNSKVTDWLSFNISSKFSNTSIDVPHGITTVDRNYLWHSTLYNWSPMTPKYNINGSIGNPLIRSHQSSGRIQTKINDFLVTVGTEIEPIKGWKTNIAYTYNIINSYMESNPKPVWVELGTGEFGNVGKPNATYNSRLTHSPYKLFNAITSYEKSLDNHFFKALVGYEQEDKFFSSLQGAGGVLITEEIPSISTSLGESTVDDTKWDWATQGVFGRINYNFKEKYLIEFSARYNGSSRFDPDSRWGFFPSGSVGYQVSKENFWSPIERYVNTFKIRASYGSLGNQNVASYLYIPSIPIIPQTPWILGGQRPAYARTPGLISDGLTWEKITTINIGIDAAFLKNRLVMNFDWFTRTTTDMFGPAETLPYTLGTSAPRANNAELETKGFELILNWQDRLSSDFSYNAQIGIGDAKSTILNYVNESGFINTWYDGKEVGEIWGLVTEGIIQTDAEAASMPDQSAIYSQWGAGDMQYKDLDGDGEITFGNRTLDDHGDLTVIGNSTPRYNVTISGGFNWKDFDFSMQWFGYGKRDFYANRDSRVFTGLTRSWGSSGVIKGAKTLDYWRPADETNMFGPNTDSYFAKPYFSRETYKNRETQSRFVLNSAFLRLKFLQLGYTIPQKLSKRAFIQKARIFISGENLITFTSLPEAMDPESSLTLWGSGGGGASYPIARTLSMGVNITF